MQPFTFALVVVFVALAAAMLAYVTILRHWRVSKSVHATREEKNRHHAATLISLGPLLLVVVVFNWFEIPGAFLVNVSVGFYALFIAPLRTLFVEMGLRRVREDRL